jgi:hypothetical protein
LPHRMDRWGQSKAWRAERFSSVEAVCRMMELFSSLRQLVTGNNGMDTFE